MFILNGVAFIVYYKVTCKEKTVKHNTCKTKYKSLER